MAFVTLAVILAAVLLAAVMLAVILSRVIGAVTTLIQDRHAGRQRRE